MSGRLTRDAYIRLVREDLDWLRAQPRSLERDHIESLLSEAAAYAYPEDDAATVERVARVLHRQTAVRSWEGASGLEQDQCRHLARVLLRALPAPHAPEQST